MLAFALYLSRMLQGCEQRWFGGLHVGSELHHCLPNPHSPDKAMEAVLFLPLPP